MHSLRNDEWHISGKSLTQKRLVNYAMCYRSTAWKPAHSVCKAKAGEQKRESYFTPTATAATDKCLQLYSKVEGEGVDLKQS